MCFWEKKVCFQNKNLVPAGEIDLEILSELHMKHPGVTVDNEVVEPSSQQLHNYRGTAFIGTHSHIPHIYTASVYSDVPAKYVLVFSLTANKVSSYFLLYFLLLHSCISNTVVHVLVGGSSLTSCPRLKPSCQQVCDLLKYF